MSGAYRDHRRPRTVIVGRLRASAPLFGLFALFALGAPMFAATTAPLSIHCERSRDDEVSCTVTTRGAQGFRLVEPIDVVYEPGRLIAPNATGRDVLIDGEYSEADLRAMGAVLERVRTRRLPSDEAAAGGLTFDRRLLIPGLLLSVAFLVLSLRRRRIVVDHDVETLVATTLLGVIPISRRRATLPREPSVRCEHENDRRRLVLESRHGRVVLFEGRDDELETLAREVSAAHSVGSAASSGS